MNELLNKDYFQDLWDDIDADELSQYNEHPGRELSPKELKELEPFIL